MDSLLKLAEMTSTANRSITLLDYLILDLERKSPELLGWPEDVPSIRNSRNSVCQESNSTQVIEQDLSRITGSVRKAATCAGLKLEEVAADTGSADPLCAATVAFCVHAKEKLGRSTEALSMAEGASSGLLEYLAEPTNGSTVKVLSIIATFQLRYTQQQEKHSSGNMKRVLERAFGAPHDQTAGARQRAASEPVKPTVTPEALGAELAQSFLLRTQTHRDLVANKLPCHREEVGEEEAESTESAA